MLAKPMRGLLTIILILSFTLTKGQKSATMVPEKVDTPILRLSWMERESHSGIPNWHRLSRLFFVDSVSRQKIHDSIATILSYDLIINDEKNDNDSLVFHIINTDFAKNYIAVVRKMIPGSYVVITNIRYRTKWMNSNEFIYRPKENEILMFRNL